MRISDWSLDVCSSDLAADDGDGVVPEEEAVAGGAGRDAVADQPALVLEAEHERLGARGHDHGPGPVGGLGGVRSEEHTSELQSLMRISYAVFCLKKKHNHTHNIKVKHNNTIPTIH